jgi:hypothetical protein
MTKEIKTKPKNTETLEQAADRIYHEWDTALANNDVDALMALYSPDATIESPLIVHLMVAERGVCHGEKEIRKLLEAVAARKPLKRQHYRTKYFTDGKTLMWEYPRVSPDGEQMDFMEVMELKNGLIQHHRIYWGWYGIDVIKNDKYRR